jgi:isopentenyldiphosphate isomerase/intracellular septation protein A
MLDRKTLIKNFSIGFLPLLVFIVADKFFGLTVGLIVAILFGLVELLFTYIKEKRLDKFIFFDTGLILILGLVSLIFQNDIFFKIKPGLIELILVLLLGVTAFLNNPILIKMSGRYMKDIPISDDQFLLMQNMMKRMFYVFLGHTILVFYAAFYMSNEAWAFVSGGLFYGLMIGIIIVEFLRTKIAKSRLKNRFKNEEWFDLVTPEGKIIGKAPRSVVHGNPELLHPVVHIHILNNRGEIFLQKRALNKAIQPGKWDTSVGGHIHAGESIEHALNREAEEELGISFAKFIPIFKYVMKNEIESELVHAFLLKDEGPFFPDPEEISDARFWSLSEIETNLGKSIFTPNFEQELDILKRIVFNIEDKRFQ